MLVLKGTLAYTVPTMALDRLSLFFLCVTAVTQAAAPTANPYAKLPLAFERQGERYVARGNGYQIALQGGSAAIGLQSQDGSGSSITMDFVRSRKVSGTAGPELPGKVNYVRGNDPKQWRLGLSTYDSVAYREIYRGIDVVYRGNQRQMEFDVVLGPGADPGSCFRPWAEERCPRRRRIGRGVAPIADYAGRSDQSVHSRGGG